MPARKPNSIPWNGVVVLLALIGGYVGSYFAMVTPKTRKFQNLIGASLLVTAPRYLSSDEDEGGVAKRVFAPLHWLDRRIRPHTWGPKPTKQEWETFRGVGLPRGLSWEPSE
ncbi:MAG: hypothetical protein IT428_17490 [Planctomycetaceae bacterium]|nr:hypothetical protein [Planctomycetaceae bacterium]